MDKKYWGFGYATEAVRARMKVEGKFVKVYKGEKMLHLIYSILKEDRNK